MTTATAPVQYYRVLTPGTKAALDKLRDQQELLVSSSHAPNTLRAYAAAWNNFTGWCRNWLQCEPLPASPHVVSQFITWASQMREPAYKPQTIQLAVVAIRRFHKEAQLASPIDDCVRSVLAGVNRQAARNGARPEQAGKRNLTVDQLKKICRHLGTTPVEVRDRTLILVGFVSALRRSDLSRISTDNVHFEDGRVRIWVPYSKTDQLGGGRSVFLRPAEDPSFCPVRALEDWKRLRLEYFGNFRGALFLRFSHNGDGFTNFRLGPGSFSRILKRSLVAVGEDPKHYAAHSMRSGMITAADAAGANVRSIMDHTGHKSLETVMRYIKSNRGANPLAGVL